MTPNRLLSHLLAALAGTLVPSFARADGVAFQADDTSEWRPAQEDEQIAAIECANGRETLTLAVGLRLDEKQNALWIFPIPAGAKDPKLEIVDQFPQFHGSDPRVSARANTWKFGLALRCMTIVTIPFEFCELMPTLGADPSFSVYADVEKQGLRAELVRADSLEKLAEHLHTNGVELSPARLRSLEPYLGEHWRFVIGWITSRARLRSEFPAALRGDLQKRVPCLRVEFDSAAPFFPLRPSSGLSGDVVGIRVYVRGYYAPTSATGLKLWCRHFVQDGAGYTLVSGYANPAFLVEDLRLGPVQPHGMFIASAINLILLNPIGWAAVFVGFSVLAGAAAGKLAFADARRGIHLGMFHVGSLAAIIMRLRHEQFATPPNADPILYQRVIRRDFAKFFTLVFVALTILLQAGLLFLLPNAPD